MVRPQLKMWFPTWRFRSSGHLDLPVVSQLKRWSLSMDGNVSPAKQETCPTDWNASSAKTNCWIVVV
jgi:hypothetical protein